MRSVQTQQRFELSSVKPFERLSQYRQLCLDRTRQALSAGAVRRVKSPAGKGELEPFGSVEGIDYLRCPETGSFFLAQLPAWQEWSSRFFVIHYWCCLIDSKTPTNHTLNNAHSI